VQALQSMTMLRDSETSMPSDAIRVIQLPAIRPRSTRSKTIASRRSLKWIPVTLMLLLLVLTTKP
jgi:hypothetical protein